MIDFSPLRSSGRSTRLRVIISGTECWVSAAWVIMSRNSRRFGAFASRGVVGFSYPYRLHLSGRELSPMTKT